MNPITEPAQIPHNLHRFSATPYLDSTQSKMHRYDYMQDSWWAR